MSISSEITRITGAIADAYTAASGKGATMPGTQNAENLANCIGSIRTPQMAWGVVTPPNEGKFSTLRIENIVDGNGNSFTPTGVALIVKDNAATTHTYEEVGAVAVLQIVGTMNSTSIVAAYTSAKSIRTNREVKSTFGPGYFEYSHSNTTFYLQPGRWMWLAWNADSEDYGTGDLAE